MLAYNPVGVVEHNLVVVPSSATTKCIMVKELCTATNTRTKQKVYYQLHEMSTHVVLTYRNTNASFFHAVHR